MLRDIVNHDKSFEPSTSAAAASGMSSSVRQRLRTARGGLTQTDLGERIGIGQSAVSMWETGNNNVGIEDIKKVARATGRSAIWIAFGDESGVNEEEAALLASYRSMPRDRQLAFLTMIGGAPPAAEPERPKRPFPKRS